MFIVTCLPAWTLILQVIARLRPSTACLEQVCHGNFGPGSKIFGKIGPGGHRFSEKIGPDSKFLVRCSLSKSSLGAHAVYLAPGV